MEELTITEIQSRLVAGELTAAALTEKYLRRIAQIDRSGPALNSVIELNPDALEIAARLDVERQEGRVRDPLHGVPILIKDNIDTADRMQTTAGSLALEGNVAAQDATTADRLRAAGAVILGKTNPSEWANFRSSHSTSGWAARGGGARERQREGRLQRVVGRPAICVKRRPGEGAEKVRERARKSRLQRLGGASGGEAGCMRSSDQSGPRTSGAAATIDPVCRARRPQASRTPSPGGH